MAKNENEQLESVLPSNLPLRKDEELHTNLYLQVFNKFHKYKSFNPSSAITAFGFFPTFKSKNLSINIVCLTDGSQNWIQRAAWTGTHTDTRDKSFQNSAILPDALLEIFLAFEKLHIIICVLHRTKKLWKNMISTGRLLKEKRNSLERAGTSNCSVSETLIS